MKKIELKELGLDSNTEKQSEKYSKLYLARVSEQHRDIYKVISEEGELKAEVSGKFAYFSEENIDYPVVGDWVMIDRTSDACGNAIIHHILSRKSVFERKAAGTSNQNQIIAANIDLIFICMALNNDFNLRRLERYLSVVWSGGSTPVVVLTKSDLCLDLSEKLAEVYGVAIGTEVVVTSGKDPLGYQEICKYIEPGKTIAFVGSSGVGKSTLINRLLGSEVLNTQGLRNDDKGRHTTTYRQLLILPDGGIVIDTPGMRELQLNSGDLSKSFEDIEELAANCKFNNCTHTNEPGCKVIEALKNGELTNERLESYFKLKKETGYEGLNFREVEHEKIKNMFGSVGGMKQAKEFVKNKKKY